MKITLVQFIFDSIFWLIPGYQKIEFRLPFPPLIIEKEIHIIQYFQSCLKASYPICPKLSPLKMQKKKSLEFLQVIFLYLQPMYNLIFTRNFSPKISVWKMIISPLPIYNLMGF